MEVSDDIDVGLANTQFLEDLAGTAKGVGLAERNEDRDACYLIVVNGDARIVNTQLFEDFICEFNNIGYVVHRLGWPYVATAVPSTMRSSLCPASPPFATRTISRPYSRVYSRVLRREAPTMTWAR